MFRQLLIQVQNKYKEKVEENEKYKEILNKVNTLPKFYNYSHTGNDKPTISYKLPVMNYSLDNTLAYIINIFWNEIGFQDI